VLSRAEFEKNLLMKKKDIVFNNNIAPLLSVEQSKQYQLEQAYDVVFKYFLAKLNGKPWQGNKES